MRLAFLGTPEVAVGPLRALVDAGHDVALVVSRPDRRRGRGGALVPSPVKAAALELGLPVTDKVDDVHRRRRRAGGGGGLRPADQAPRPRRRADGEPPLLAAAPVAGGGAGGAGHPGGRRRHRRVRHGPGGGARHGPGLRLRGASPSAPTRPPTSCGPALSPSGDRPCWCGCSTRACPSPRPQEGEATYAAKLDPGEHHLDWSQPAVRPPPGGAPGPGVDDVPGQAAARPPGSAGAAGRRRPLAEGEHRPVHPRGRHRRGRGADPGGGAARGQGPCRPAAPGATAPASRPATAWGPDPAPTIRA